MIDHPFKNLTICLLEDAPVAIMNYSLSSKAFQALSNSDRLKYLEHNHYYMMKIFQGVNLFIIAFVIGFFLMMTLDIVRGFFSQIKMK